MKMLKDHQITVATFVPSILNYVERYLSELRFEHLRYSFFIGDKLLHEQADKWQQALPNGELINFYGPTEATIMCTFYEWSKQQEMHNSEVGIVPIGKPFPGITYRLIDSDGKLVAEKGELCLAGKQVIQHYLNDAYSEKFIELETENGTTTFYKTGDLVSLDEEGNLHFHDRIDNQVKINGHRIELNEVELLLRSWLTDFTVSCIQDQNKSNQLILFVKKTENKDLSIIHAGLKANIPFYMQPHRIVWVDEIPYNFNGKVDRKALEQIYHEEFR